MWFFKKSWSALIYASKSPDTLGKEYYTYQVNSINVRCWVLQVCVLHTSVLWIYTFFWASLLTSRTRGASRCDHFTGEENRTGTCMGPQCWAHLRTTGWEATTCRFYTPGWADLTKMNVKWKGALHRGPKYYTMPFIWNVQIGKYTETESRLMVARRLGGRWGVTANGHRVS